VQCLSVTVLRRRQCYQPFVFILLEFSTENIPKVKKGYIYPTLTNLVNYETKI
jgi:hypothetical protein